MGEDTYASSATVPGSINVLGDGVAFAEAHSHWVADSHVWNTGGDKYRQVLNSTSYCALI